MTPNEALRELPGAEKMRKEMQEVKEKYKNVNQEELQAMARVYRHATPIEVIQVTLLSRIAVALEELVKQGAK